MIIRRNGEKGSRYSDGNGRNFKMLVNSSKSITIQCTRNDFQSKNDEARRSLRDFRGGDRRCIGSLLKEPLGKKEPLVDNHQLTDSTHAEGDKNKGDVHEVASTYRKSFSQLFNLKTFLSKLRKCLTDNNLTNCIFAFSKIFCLPLSARRSREKMKRIILIIYLLTFYISFSVAQKFVHDEKCLYKEPGTSFTSDITPQIDFFIPHNWVNNEENLNSLQIKLSLNKFGSKASFKHKQRSL
ncbi:hypothetical protein Anas_14302 [Armadillidium nasatum]|uniref:Uncharacterized protein n=1 Tax=Armadillidium nasatum TaxID=96803 RepID=A0A5N5T391_9CRUS|nr:hypothetical protein Anas_14302 [Armadillidium nasatum]